MELTWDTPGADLDSTSTAAASSSKNLATATGAIPTPNGAKRGQTTILVWTSMTRGMGAREHQHLEA